MVKEFTISNTLKNVPVLIGMRGSGKSTIAPLLAHNLELNWIDADHELERRENTTIRELLANSESHFRYLEEKLVLDLLSLDRTIVATGGGAVLSPLVRMKLSERMTIFLDVPPDQLSKRILGSEDRPSLTGKPVEDEIEEILEERRPLYESCAKLKIVVQPFDTALDIVKRIISESSIKTL